MQTNVSVPIALIDVEKIVTVYARDSDGIGEAYRHYPHRIASLFFIAENGKQMCSDPGTNNDGKGNLTSAEFSACSQAG